MRKSLIDETFDVYMQMRLGGKEAKAALDALRFRIEIMPSVDQAELVRRVKAWEGTHMGPVPTPGKPQPIAKVKPAAPPPSKAPPSAKPAASPAPSSSKALPSTKSAAPPSSKAAVPEPEPAQAQASKTLLCSRCGKSNAANEVFCIHCGNFLRSEQSSYETTKLTDPDLLMHGPDFFGEHSTLMLVIDQTSYSYKLQPQRYKHETVLGRSEGSTMKPDLDLSAHNAAEMGVSRLHVAVQYNAKNSLLSVSDMKSANGTFINGQKLYPQEVRVLRDGDELRLGKLVLHVYFQHGDPSPKS